MRWGSCSLLLPETLGFWQDYLKLWSQNQTQVRHCHIKHITAWTNEISNKLYTFMHMVNLKMKSKTNRGAAVYWQWLWYQKMTVSFLLFMKCNFSLRFCTVTIADSSPPYTQSISFAKKRDKAQNKQSLTWIWLMAFFFSFRFSTDILKILLSLILLMAIIV